MSIDVRDKAELEKRLWKEIEEGRYGMLGVMSPPHRHFAPMTGFIEPESGKIWFYTNVNTELAKAATTGAPAMFIIMAKDQEFQACVGGQLQTVLDPLHRDKFWTPVVAAWFPKGKDDSNLTLLCLTCDDAEVWITEEGPVKFGWEIAKANLIGSTPDIGGHATVTLR